ncbi:signal peptidase II [Magnetovibrio sp.]|uniref:signal peptidase II n=1 Tax=Magnetovibrio sp. TaxID=2024836 RepID=UPI002F956CD9
MSGEITDHRAARQVGWGLAVAILIADQISKWLILGLFSDATRPYFEITPFFNIVLAWNRGISFGMFGNAGEHGDTILIVLTLAIAVGLSVWLTRAESRLSALALGSIIGGAVGNVIDRFRFGAVTDFLDLHVLGYHWPAFNVADSAIVIGAAMLMWESLFLGSESPTNKDAKHTNGEKSPGTDETH